MFKEYFIFCVFVLILVKQSENIPDLLKLLAIFCRVVFVEQWVCQRKVFFLDSRLFNVHCIFGAPPSRQSPIYRRRHISIAWLRYTYYVYLCILTRTHVKHLQELFALNNKMNI